MRNKNIGKCCLARCKILKDVFLVVLEIQVDGGCNVVMVGLYTDTLHANNNNNKKKKKKNRKDKKKRELQRKIKFFLPNFLSLSLFLQLQASHKASPYKLWDIALGVDVAFYYYCCCLSNQLL